MAAPVPSPASRTPDLTRERPLPGRWARARHLPPRAWLAGAVLLACAAVPPAAALAAAWQPAAAWPGQDALNALALLVAALAVLAFEPPRTASPAGYARQLRERLRELQAVLDAGERRRTREGEENADDPDATEP